MSLLIKGLFIKKLSLAFAGIFLFLSSQASAFSSAYWIWAGIHSSNAPLNSTLYIYEGNIRFEASQFSFKKKGIFPHPLQAESIMLTYRMEGSDTDITKLLALFRFHAELWQRHKVKVAGIQLDWDFPTSKLEEYSLILSRIRTELHKDYKLSITGLADWALHAKPTALSALHKSADELVYQIYQVDTYVRGAEAYVKALEKQKRPYKLGLLEHTSPPFQIERLQYMNGVVYFIQRFK